MSIKTLVFHVLLIPVALIVSVAPAFGSVVGNSSSRSTLKKKAKWTVMLYMNGDNSLDPYAILDFKEMARVKDDSRVNVVIQLDRKQLPPGVNATDESWSETRRFLMKQSLRPTRSDSIQDFCEESNMGDPETLATFVDWAKSTFPAERYMLIIWSHGDGWRRPSNADPFFADPERGAKARERAIAEAEMLLMQGLLTDSKLSSLNLQPTATEAQIRTISEDETNSFDKLYMREIQDALEGVFAGTRGLEVIGFDACLMQMIETAYAVRNVAAVIIGSEELEPGEGWSYDEWLRELVANPNMDGNAISSSIVKAYKKTYENVNPATTLSAISLANNHIDQLAQAISLLAKELLTRLDAELGAIKAARDSCNIFAPERRYHGVDLHRFCAQLDQPGVSTKLRARARRVMSLLKALVISNYAGKLRQDRFGSQGLAIYFPANNEVYQLDPYRDAYRDDNNAYVVQFVKEHEWDNFLQSYFKRV